MKNLFKISLMTIALGTVIAFTACSSDDDDSCDGLEGIELANCLDSEL